MNNNTLLNGFEISTIKMIRTLLITAFFFVSALSVHANHADTSAKKKADTLVHADTTHHTASSSFDINEVIFSHIQDAHEFHFFTYKEFHATLSLPVIVYSPQRGWSCFSSQHFHHGHENFNGYALQKEKIIPVDNKGNIDATIQVYDLSMTKNVVQMLLALLFFVWIVLKATKVYVQDAKKTPRGIQSFLEPVILFVKNDIAIANLGKHKGMKYVPFFLTVFFFILINNLFGLIPGSANVTGNIAFTFTLSIFSLLVILLSTNKHFWSHIFWPPGPIFVKVILIPIELIGIFTKPFALMVRLFANMIAGHIIIICFISLIFIFSQLSIGGGLGFSPVSILFTVFIYVIEILVAFIQAFIFTNLTAVFIAQAMEGSHDEH